MEFVQNTPEVIKQMLSTIGVNSLDDLFESIPSKIRIKDKLELPEGLSEYEIFEHLNSISKENISLEKLASFLGAGCYDHYIPAIVDELSSRSEFYTSYTPYQPEVSQGNLQVAFEYQTMICELTGMDISNASHYDGATAVAEAISMAIESTNRNKILISSLLNPFYINVIKTFFSHAEYKIQMIKSDGGLTSAGDLEKNIDSNTACVVIQNPNFFGCVEDIEIFSKLAKGNGALAIASCDPVSLGILKTPGECGFDIVTGDGQSLGIDLCFGGPTFGFMAVKKELVRKLPGRIVGETIDKDGKCGFVLTLQAREQHIRREKATSNICTNQALMTLRAAVYLSALGKEGIVNLAKLCIFKTHYLAKKISELDGASLPFNAPFFREFVIKLKRPAAYVNDKLLEKGILGGLELERYYPDMKNCWLLSCTEKITRQKINNFIAILKQILQ